MPRDVDEALERLAEAELEGPATSGPPDSYEQDPTHGENEEADIVASRSDRARGFDVDTAVTRDERSSVADGTASAVSPDPTDWPTPNAVARCCHCYEWLHDDEVECHHDDCSGRTVGCCRFCGDEFATRSEIRTHYDCAELRRWFLQHGHTVDEEKGPEDGDPDAVPFQSAVEPQPHECSAYLKYDTSDLSPSFQWYSGIVALARSATDDVTPELTYTVGELSQATRQRAKKRSGSPSDDEDTCERWVVETEWKASGIAAPDHERLDGWIWPHDDVGEPIVQLYPAEYDSYTDAADDGAKRVTYQLSPRWPGQKSTDGHCTNPIELTGVDVEVHGTNFEFCRYPTLLEDAVSTLEDCRRSGGHSVESIDARAFDPDRLHESSNVVDAELYVRVRSEKTGQVYAFDGTLHRISWLLSSVRDGYAASVRDDTACPGYYHTATVGDRRAAELVDGHRFAKEFKHYHVSKPDAVDTEPLSEPKLATSFQHSKSDETVYWDDLDGLERELEEALLGLLQWSDIPVRPDGDTYVADDHFVPTHRPKFRRVVSDPTPDIRTGQERRTQLVLVAGEMTDIDRELLRTLLEDGRRFSQRALAEEIGCCARSIRRSIDRLDGLVVHDHGDVRIRSQYVAEKLVDLLPELKASANRDDETAVDDLLKHEGIGTDTEDSAWERFKNSYVESVEERTDGKDEIELGVECDSREELRRLVRGAAVTWQTVSDADFSRLFATEYNVRGRVDGDREEVLSMGALRDVLPGGSSASTVT